MAMRAVGNMRGDDLERAKMAFRGMTSQHMREQHGQSGRTRQEILDGYQTHADNCTEVLMWLESL